MRFSRVRAACVVVGALAASAVVAVQSPAQAAITSTNITGPADGTHFMITGNIPGTVTVTGTTTGGTTGDFVDIRCYEIGSATWQLGPSNVPVQNDGSFSASMNRNVPFGTCRLRAVPHNLPKGSDISAYAGPRVTTESVRPLKVDSGPNAGKTYDYYVAFQGSHALNDYASATQGGFWDARMSYPDGSSSNYFWYGNAVLKSDTTRSRLQVDGRNAYGPSSAFSYFPNNSGLPQVTFSASRNGTTGVTTIRESEPIVVCPGTTYPPTAGSCPKFNSAGILLERTIVTTDGGRQVHVTDVWRSTDGRSHSISPYYYQSVEGADWSTTVPVDTPVGLRLPWLGGFQTYTGDETLPGPAQLANTIFVRDDDGAPSGDTLLPRGAMTFDFPLSGVHRTDNDKLTTQGSTFTVAAGRTRVLRQSFVMGTTDAEVAGKAAANQARLNPYRVDGLIKRKVAKSYAGNGIYNSTGAGQTVLSRTKRTRTAVFYVLVQNDGNQPSTMRVTGTGARPGYAVQYYTGASGGQRITGSVVRGQYLVSNLAPGSSKLIRLVVKVKAGTPIGRVGSWLVRATSTKNPARTDVVRAKVKVRS